MNRLASRLAPLAAFTIGLLNTTGIPPLMVISIVAPVLAGMQPTRARAGLSAAVYYAACTWPAFVVILNYLGVLKALVFGPAICLAGCCLLAAPFWVLWSDDRRRAAWMMPFAILLSAVPPLGIIGIGNPLLVSGLLFPTSRWLGVLLTLVFPSALLVRPRSALTTMVMISGLFHICSVGDLRQPEDWTGVDTTNTCSAAAPECKFNVFAAVRKQAEALTTGVLVFPEATFQDWNDAIELFWQETDEVLRHRSVTVLIGATLRQNSTIRNVVLVRGADRNTFVQRVPVPIGMWQPLTKGKFPLNVDGPATTLVRGHNVAVLICYEQSIPWTWITAMAAKPDLIVAISNDIWSHGTPLKSYRSAVARSWSELFTLPLVAATNE